MIDYVIEPDAGIIFARANAELVGNDVGEVMAEVLRDPNYDPSFDLLADISAVALFSLARNTRGELREFAANRADVRRAFVVGQSFFAREFARLYRLALGFAPDKFGVFANVDEARDWLAGEQPK